MGGAVRDATIESVGEVKLLVIRAEEFLSLGGDGEEDDEPEHIRFCRYKSSHRESSNVTRT